MRQQADFSFSSAMSRSSAWRVGTPNARSPLQQQIDRSPRQVSQLKKVTGFNQLILQRKGGLPDNLRAAMEQLSGFSLDDVKVHYNSSKPAQVNALAYAQGTDIYLGPGQEGHLPHEAWHIVQQKQGRVRPTMQVNGMAVNDNPSLEREADMMGLRAGR